MNFFITGGAGYIGSVFIEELLKRNNQVTVLDNFIFGQNSLVPMCGNKNLEVINADVRDFDYKNSQSFNEADFIFPLAALVGMPICNRDKVGARTINYEAIKQMLTARKEQKIIYPTTNSGYGIGQSNIYCTEETPLKPISLYGITKSDAEKAILDNGNSITLRLATVFGVSYRMRYDLLVNSFVKATLEDKVIVLFEANFKRNYIHVRDVANAFIHCIDNFDSMKNNIYNVGMSDCNISKKELCEEISKQIKFYYTEAEIGKDIDQRNYIVSNEKIEKTGYFPTHTLQEGITEIIKSVGMINSTVQQGNNPIF